MRKKHFLKVGEFARICRTTKETLLHYDRKGLLKPKHINENGYRGYSAEQYFDFDLISLFKDAGYTLEEIKKLRSTCGTQGYLKFVKEKIAYLQEEKLRLTHRISMLSRLVVMAEEAVASTFDTLFWEEREEESILFYPVDSGKMLNREKSVECYSDCLLDSLAHGNSIDLPLGTIIPRAYAIDNNFNICYLFRKASKNEDGDIRKIRKGRYACLFHQGYIDSHISAFNFMIHEINKMKLKIISDVYVFDQMSYILSDTSTNYIAKYIVNVE